MHRNITFMFDCWADPVAHLLLLKSSTTNVYVTKQIVQKQENWKQYETGADVLAKFYSSIAMPSWNKALWLDVQSHVTSLNQS